MVTVKSNFKVGVNWNKFFKENRKNKRRKNKILLPWLLEKRLVSWKTAIEETYMYTLDVIDTQFTSKWTGVRYCEGE